MSTVNCPNCNKPNIEGSKFCNSCGFALPLSTHIICPNCETRNPRNLLYCDNCGTRLSATGDLSSRREEQKEPEAETRAPRAFSLPAREPGDELDPDNLLDWLRRGAEQADTAETQSGQEAVLDDWLSELSDIELADADAEETLTDWFQDVEETEEAQEEPEGLASWFSDSDETLVEEGGLADWLSELENGEEEGEEETADEETELPGTDILGPVRSLDADIGDTLIAPSPFQQEEQEEDALPDWFRDLEEIEADEEPEETSPDWLSGFDLEEGTPTLIEPTPVQEEDEEGMPDWLSDLEPKELESSPEAEEVEAEEIELPDWFSHIEEEPVAQAGIEPEAATEEEDIPDWLSDIETDEEMPTLIAPTPEAQEEELPEWLSDLSESGDDMPTLVAPSPETEADEALPDWLSDAALEEETADEEALPDWLSEAGLEEETADEEALPDWLSTAEPEEAGADDEDLVPDWFGEADAVEEESEAEAIMDWLDDFEVEEGETAEAETASPDWLGEFLVDEGEPDLDAFISETAGEEPLPGWLSEFGDSPGVVDEAEIQDEALQWDEVAAEAPSDWAEEIEVGEETEDDDGGEMPDWLSEMPSYDTRTLSPEELNEEETADIFAEIVDPNLTPVDELPDWLSDIVPAEEEPESETAEEMEEEDGLPDWLSDLPEQGDTFEPSGDTDWLAALAQDEPWPDVVDDEEIVAQLDELEETPLEIKGPSQELKGVPKELAGSSLPDWLQEDMPEPELAAEEVSIDDPFGVGSDQLAQGELPDWLRQMKPADLDKTTGDLGLDVDFPLAEGQDEWQKILENMPPSPETMPGATALSAAEIPAWLQALKPRDFGEAEEDLPESDEPPETKGPLAGLRGALPAASVMTETIAAKTPVQYTISKEQQQQIALLHRLTHEEPEATKQVSFKQAASFSTPWRALLGVLLFLVVLAGVILPRAGIDLLETSLPVPESALNTFNTMQAASGRSVLVAFEYTPAMAGELDPIAQMLLRQMAENGNRVLTISQSAVGTALADRAVAEVEGLDSRALPLLPGEAVGLRNLGSCLNSPEDCDFLLTTDGNPELRAELSDIGLIIVLTSDRSSLVNWIEQVERQKEVPVIAAVTQPLGPLTVPYISSGQLEGTLNGIPAASAYEKRLRGLDGSAFEQFTAQTIVMWVVVVALIVAAVVYGTAGLAGGRSNKGSG